MATRNKFIGKSPKKRGPGRPRKADAINEVIPVGLTKELVEALDAWCEREGVKFRSAAIRRFIVEGLQRGKR